MNWKGKCQAGRLFILVAVAVASPVYNTDLIIAAALCWVVRLEAHLVRPEQVVAPEVLLPVLGIFNHQFVSDVLCAAVAEAHFQPGRFYHRRVLKGFLEVLQGF